MKKIFYPTFSIFKKLYFWIIILLAATNLANAQTLTIGTVDAGPYSAGSTIGVTFSINDATSCINQSNIFSLYMASTPGGLPDTQIGTYSGFFSTFVNGIIPATLVSGSYQLEIRASSPAVSSTRATITIAAGAVISAKINSQSISSSSQEVFGNCNGKAASFDFINQSTAGSTVTANFFNELSQASEGTLTLSPSISFAAKTAHYTIMVKAANNGVIATKAYALVNNVVNTSFGATGSNTVCLAGGKGSLVYNMDITSANGLQKNYPGNLYLIDWGDGSAGKYSICDIKALNSQINHDYTKASCGVQANGRSNVFPVNISINSPFCGSIGTQVTSYAKVLTPPKNAFSSSDFACLNVPVNFRNTSFPGDDPNSTSIDCRNLNAKYSWYVDGSLVLTNANITDTFTYTFTTTGSHIVLLRIQNGGGCDAVDYTHTICVEDVPKPKFSLTDSVFCSSSAVTPIDQSIVDNSCTGSSHIYTWTVTGPASVGYAGGTDSHSKQPQFTFTRVGTYKAMLSIDAACGGVNTATQTIIINTNPVATLSPDKEVCGKDQLLTFDNKTGITQTILTGTTLELPDTYTWTVTGGAYTFKNGTNANSKYPQILFSDYGIFTVTVTHKNTCGTITGTQKLNFKQSPTVNAGPNQVICPGNNVTLAGSITGPVPQSFAWVGGTGTFAPDRNTLTAVYTPSNADINAGQVTLTLHVVTSNPQPCDIVNTNVIITINPTNTVTSAASNSICTGTAVGYQPVSTLAGSTFTYTATATANASGFTASGTGAINDVITNTDAVNNATVTYTITPTANGCNGTAFTYTVTVTPKPIITATAANSSICSGTNAGIVLSSNLLGTTYTWTSKADAGILGNTNQATSKPATSINDMLTNNNTTAATVTYTITPFNSTGCQGTPVTVTITILAPPIQAVAGPSESICNSPTYVLKGNAPAPFTGQWSVITGTGVTFADATQPNTTVSGLQPGQQYTFRWTITGTSSCPSTTSDVVINDLPPLTNNINFAQPKVCQGQTITILGDDPTGGNKVYSYSWQTSIDNTIWQDVSGQNGHDLTILVTSSLYYRRVVNSSACSNMSNSILILSLPPVTPNTVSPDQTICINTQPAIINGSQPAGAGGGYIYQWQKSENKGQTWVDIVGATLKDYQSPVLLVSMQFRRNVSTQICSGAFASTSNTATITVNPTAKAQYTFVNDKSCTPFIIDNKNIQVTDYPDRNLQYTWYVNGVQIGTGIQFPGYTIGTDGVSVDVKLVATNKFNCGDDVFTHTFTSIKEVIAGFTQDVTFGCGPLIVNFTNTSSPMTNSTFAWTFGNGNVSTQVNPASITFQPNPNGKDTTYTIKLIANTVCGIKTATSTVTVRSKAKTSIFPDNVTGCSPLTINMVNVSTGDGSSYTYDFGDGQPIQTVTNKQPVSHVYVTNKTKSYIIKATAFNDCGIGATQSYTITVSPNGIVPSLTVNATELAGCAPWAVNFQNNTTGASSFDYDFGDGSPHTLSSTFPEVVAHTYLKGGTYTATLKSTNGCSFTTTTKTITVYPQPVPNFTADVTNGCKKIRVNFTNNTPVANTYLWDFGDGTTSTDINPTHIFDDSKSPYTITLTATADMGCPAAMIKTAYITVNPSPGANFTVNPDQTIEYPNVKFAFTDLSIHKPVAWIWNFGDGKISNRQNPDHAYADTGMYRVRLIAYNSLSCSDTLIKTVHITGIPGQLFIANAFMPNSKMDNLTTFKAIGSGIKVWNMQVFNNYGQLIWQTNKLSPKGEPMEGWDGTIQGTAAQQGIYIWKISATFLNGREWTGMSFKNAEHQRTGPLTLIR